MNFRFASQSIWHFPWCTSLDPSLSIIMAICGGHFRPQTVDSGKHDLMIILILGKADMFVTVFMLYCCVDCTQRIWQNHRNKHVVSIHRNSSSPLDGQIHNLSLRPSCTPSHCQPSGEIATSDKLKLFRPIFRANAKPKKNTEALDHPFWSNFDPLRPREIDWSGMKSMMQWAKPPTYSFASNVLTWAFLAKMIHSIWTQE